MNAPSTPYVSCRSRRREEIGLKELLNTLRARWGFILCVTAAFAVVTTTAAFLLPKTYEATALLSPVSSSSSDGLLSGAGAIASQLGGLSSLAGLSGLSTDSKKSESVAMLQSDTLAQKYIRDNSLLPVLYEDLWDPVGKRWKVTDAAKIPTLWRASELFKNKIRTVKTDGRTGLVTLTIEWKDPKLAATWANDLVRMTNDYLRSKAIVQSERNIAYLNNEAASTNVVDAKHVMYAVLQNEISKAMLAKGTDEYAFKVIDPALVAEKPASPKPLVWLIVGLVGGLSFSLLLVMIRAAYS